MSTYSFVSNLRKGMSLRVFLPLLSVVLIVLQFVLPTVASASSAGGGFTFGTFQDIDRASVSVVRLVATYGLLTNPGCNATSTSVGVLVGSWTTSANPQDFTNWVLTDGALVNPEGMPCGTSKTTAALTTMNIYANTAYTSTATGTLVASLSCQPSATSSTCKTVTGNQPETLQCQFGGACATGGVIIPFHTPVPQPFVSVAPSDQTPATSANIELTGATSYPPAPTQAMQALTPSRVLSNETNVKVEQGTPAIDGTGQLFDLKVEAQNNETPGWVKAFVESVLPPASSNALQLNWNTGVDNFYAVPANYGAAHSAFVQAGSTSNKQFKAPTAFLALPQFKGVASITTTPSGSHTTKPTPAPTSASGKSVNILGLQVPYWLLLPLIIVGVLLVVLLLALISFLFIRRQRAQAQHRRELAKFAADQRTAAVKAAKDAERIAEQERRQQQGAPIAKHTATLGSPDLRCPNCKNPVRPTDNTCPSCHMPLTFSASGMNVRLAQPPAGISQQSPVAQPLQPPASMPMQSPPPGAVPVGAIPDQPTVQMSPGSSRSPYDLDATAPLNHTQSSNGPSAAQGSAEQLKGANSRLGFVVGTRSNPGIKRQHKPNEDSLLAVQGERSNNSNTQPFGLFVVADGMGGHANGQDASRLAIQTIVDRLMPRLSSNEPFTDDTYVNLLVEGVQEANAAVHTRNMEHRADMGTTMTAALVVGMTAFVANVGDSRTYLYREPEGLRKITNDHSVVASLVEAGIIKPDDIYTHPKRNQIYRSLGEKPMIDVDSFKVPLKPGDKLLLCSDGLWDMVRDPIIQKVLSAVPDPSQTGNALIQAALDGGGEDNVSVIVVHITNHTQLSGRPNFQLLARPEEPQYPPM